MRHMKLPLRRESFYDDALPHLPAVEYPFLSGLSYSLLPPPLSILSCQACPGWLSQSPSVSAVWDSSLVNRAHWHCGACASIATFMAHQSCLSLLRSLSLSLSLTPSPAQAVNFYWFQWARICTVIAQAGWPWATRQGAPARPAHKVPSTPLTQQFALSSADALS